MNPPGEPVSQLTILDAVRLHNEAFASHKNEQSLCELEVIDPNEESPELHAPVRLIVWELTETKERTVREIREQQVRLLLSDVKVTPKRFEEYAHGTAMAAQPSLVEEEPGLWLPADYFCAEVLREPTATTRERFNELLLGAEGVRHRLEVERDYSELVAKFPELPLVVEEERRDWVRTLFTDCEYAERVDALHRIQASEARDLAPYLVKAIEKYNKNPFSTFTEEWIPIPKALADQAEEILRNWAK